jgi:dTMP kinase
VTPGQHETRGRFITLEGGEGAGKSTQISRLETDLQGAGIDIVRTREPGGSDGAEQVRKLLVEGDVGRWQPMTEALLHFAARADHVDKVVEPALSTGQWVLCDRFADSTMAYQGYGHGLGAAKINELYQVVLGDFAPDLTIILDLPVEVGLRRTTGRGGQEDRYERMAVEFHQRLREGFLEIAKAGPERCAVVDATRSVDEVYADVRQSVHDRLGV